MLRVLYCIFSPKKLPSSLHQSDRSVWYKNESRYIRENVITQSSVSVSVDGASGTRAKARKKERKKAKVSSKVHDTIKKRTRRKKCTVTVRGTKGRTRIIGLITIVLSLLQQGPYGRRQETESVESIHSPSREVCMRSKFASSS